MPRYARLARRAIVALLSIAVVAAAIAWHDTMADPIIRTATVILPELPGGTVPLRLLLLSDLHVAGPDMPPSRLRRIVAQANAAGPDVVLIAGDLVSDKRLATRRYTLREALAPLRGLRPRLATVAVLGNHDHWRNAPAARTELTRIGAIVLQNTAVTIGPLAVGGLDDDFTGHADPDRTIAALDKLPGTPIMLSHGPDPFPALPGRVRLMLAGHTHCGQIRYPWGGAIATMSRYGDRYACGRIDEGGRTLIVSAGLGTSVLPFRFGTRPDMWLITVTPPGHGAATWR